jgi:hypothetical protein
MRDACSGENRGEEEISAEDKDGMTVAAARRVAASNGRRSKRDRFIERGLWPERGYPRHIENPRTSSGHFSLFTF